NNVTILGHVHPRFAAAIHAQWLRLNTNSRFHYAAITEFSERLAALSPCRDNPLPYRDHGSRRDRC
ncbi:hypothetical protein ACC764_39765, partial [Rhizobium ruizarguesonis]